MKIKSILLSIAATLAFVACATAESPQKITPAQGKAMIEKGEAVLVDVRRNDEYKSSHIPSAILIPNETIGIKMPKELPDLNATIIVYCRSGRRSAMAANKLELIGYKNVLDMGGIMSWPYKTVSGMEKGTF